MCTFSGWIRASRRCRPADPCDGSVQRLGPTHERQLQFIQTTECPTRNGIHLQDRPRISTASFRNAAAVENEPHGRVRLGNPSRRPQALAVAFGGQRGTTGRTSTRSWVARASNEYRKSWRRHRHAHAALGPARTAWHRPAADRTCDSITRQLVGRRMAPGPGAPWDES